MDGFHDLGGFQGFGKVPHTINSLSYKPVFKEEWEHLAYSLMFVGVDQLKKFSVDEVRHAVERLDVRQHVGTRYYERYVIATATLLVETGVITQEELNHALGSYFKLANPPHAQGRPAITGREPFKVGDRVTVRDEYFAGHIRMPRYVRGKTGVILHRTTEKWPFPDSIGHGDRDAVHQSTYHVEFAVKDLWGEAADDGFVVVDLFESYLDKAPMQQVATDAGQRAL
ncbi:nitrile hydratase subunit beta [Pectobacterium actinidiae]|uniref:Nitrile hydratase subunit beta n=1 Tax=Pectobacterium actinidiae TaxID=1507808 RepID=A0A1V2R2X1_9GAMM|nr:nitrile hydratase subunit beta [Pectobacterium actinidiae]KHN89377.1 nitrile hydratase subunit beta [Pectobacterium actinidiae]ONK03056.1 nitrile hydratase subunit beta [Pectobacterium actinidiae]ONK04804.1 nitrile hydratase subunit beta [Pectobacterium actinidiae]